MFFAIVNLIGLILLLGRIIFVTSEAVKGCTKDEIPVMIIVTVICIFFSSVITWSACRTLDYIALIR